MAMEKELVQLFESVKKAADAAAIDTKLDSSPEEDRCLDALNRLKKFPVSYDVLVSTQVGKRLRQLTKHPRKNIQVLASDVVEMWKAIIVKETSKNKKNGNIKNEATVRAEPADSDSSEAKRVQRVNSIKVEKSTKVEAVGDSDKKSFQRGGSDKAVKPVTSMSGVKAEKVNVIKTEKNTSGERVKVEKITKEEKSSSRNSDGPPKLTVVPRCKDDLRDKFRDILAEGLCRVTSEVTEDLRDEVDACDPYRVAVLVETAMFEKWGRTNGPNKFKYRSVMYNIRDPNNPDFRRKVLLGIFPPHSICELTPDDMASDARQQQNEKIKEKALFECERGGPPQASTNQFKCGRCGKHETTYYQLQTRSADEPMTTFVTCVNCNNRWKFC